MHLLVGIIIINFNLYNYGTAISWKLKKKYLPVQLQVLSLINRGNFQSVSSIYSLENHYTIYNNIAHLQTLSTGQIYTTYIIVLTNIQV